MRRSLFSLLGLITLWSLFYAGVKYFFWGMYAPSFAPTLEQITGYILIGSMIAYIIGGPLYARYSERVMLYVALVIGIGSFFSAVLLPSVMPQLFNFSMIGIGLAYSLYVIGKNTLIGREISTSSLGSSTIGAFTTVIFIVFLVVGTVVGSKIGETENLRTGGIVYFVALLFFVGVVLLVTDTRKDTTSFHFSLDLYKRLIIRYGVFMIGLACFWQISVEASQVAINYSKEVFEKSNSVSSLLLLFSSVGAILGNIVSVKLGHNRMRGFLMLASIFLLIMFGFSTVLSLAQRLDLYAIVQGLAFAIGFFFGGAVNLAESYFFSLLGDDPDKDYTSALYGFVMSLVGVVMMFVSEAILKTGSYAGIPIFLGFCALVATYGGWKGIQVGKK